MSRAPRRLPGGPVAWLLVALPLASVAGMVALLRLGGDTSFDAAPDDVRRSAQVQQRDLAPDQRALALDLRAPARFDAATGVLRIDAGTLPAGDYVVELVHPVEGRDDRREALVRRDGELRVARFDPAIAWRLRLAPASGDWRLVARWSPGEPEALLAPAFAATAEPVE